MNKFDRDKYNVMFYFGRFRRDTLSPTKKRGKNLVATETKPSFLYKHQFATVHNYSRARIHHKSRINVTLRTKISFLSRRDGRDGGQQMGAEENVFV